MEAKKIVSISPVNKSDLEYIESNGEFNNKDEVIMVAAIDFLCDELKMSSDEINDLGITKVTRPKKEDTDHFHIYFSDQTSSQYTFKKTVKVSNPDIKVSSFVPPPNFTLGSLIYLKILLLQEKRTKTLRPK